MIMDSRIPFRATTVADGRVSYQRNSESDRAARRHFVCRWLAAPELFPVAALAQAHAEVFAEDGAEACQYSTTEGWLPLRE